MRFTTTFALLALGACATANQPSGSASSASTVRVNGTNSSTAMQIVQDNTSNVKSLSYAPDAVWRVLPAVYDSVAIPVTTLNQAGRSIGNAGFNIRRRLGKTALTRLIDCGSTQGGPSADTYDIRFAITTELRASGTGTDLITTVDAMGRPAAFSGEYIRCSSNGVLEGRIADLVKQQLAGR